MALDSYDDLLVAIPKWAWQTGNTDFEASVPEFLSLVESMLMNGDEDKGIRPLRTREMEASDTIVMSGGVGDLPSDYLQYRKVTCGTNYPPLEACDPTWGEEQYRSSAGRPSYFAIVGSEIRTYPATDESLTLEYYAKIRALGSATQSNWLLAKDHRVYLYGALIAAEPFMQNDARMATWGPLFKGAVNAIANADVRSKYARVASRVRGPTP